MQASRMNDFAVDATNAPAQLRAGPGMVNGFLPEPILLNIHLGPRVSNLRFVAPLPKLRLPTLLELAK